MEPNKTDLRTESRRATVLSLNDNEIIEAGSFKFGREKRINAKEFKANPDNKILVSPVYSGA